MTYPVDDAGNVRVDFVWGHMPIQPDQQREGRNTSNQVTDGDWTVSPEVGSDNLTSSWSTISFGTGDGDGSREQTFEWGINDIATTGYSNFPSFLPNYEGDGDAALDVAVPSTIGMNDAQARAAIEGAGFVYDSSDTFIGATVSNDATVKASNPTAGTSRSTGSIVTVTFYLAPTVPSVVNFDSAAAAGEFLATNGLVLGTVTTSTEGATTENDNWVKSQSIASGTKVNAGTVVNLVTYDYVLQPPVNPPATTGPIAGFNRQATNAGDGNLNGNEVVMYVLGRTVKPAVGDTIEVTGTSASDFNTTWTVLSVNNNDSYNTGGTAVELALVSGAFTSQTSTGGTWTKI